MRTSICLTALSLVLLTSFALAQSEPKPTLGIMGIPPSAAGAPAVTAPQATPPNLSDFPPGNYASFGTTGSRLPTPQWATAIPDSPPPEPELIGFTIEGFEPSMLDTFHFFIGSMYDLGASSGSGSAVAMIDAEQGVMWAQMGKESIPGHGPVHRYGGAVNVLDGRGYLFLTHETMNLQEAASMLSSLYRQMYMTLNPGASPLRPFRLHTQGPDPDYTLEENVVLDGQWLSIKDIQEQVFQQTRCHLELRDDIYAVASCE